MAGRPTLEKYIDESQELVNALLENGYFERREFVITNNPTGVTPPPNAGLLIGPIAYRPDDPYWWGNVHFLISNRIEVISAKTNMAAIERLIRDFDRNPSNYMNNAWMRPGFKWP